MKTINIVKNIGKTFLLCSLKILLFLFIVWLFLVGAYLSVLFIDWRIVAAALPFALVLLILLIGWCMPAGKGRNRLFLSGGCLALAVVIAVASMIGVNLYENAVTIHDGLEGSVAYPRAHLPFDENSDIARLDKTASESFTPAEAPRLITASSFYPLTAAFIRATYPEVPFDSNGESTYLAVNRSLSFISEGKYDVYIDRRGSGNFDIVDEETLSSVSTTTIGKDAVVLYTHEDNGVTDLTGEEVKGILTGKIVNWKEVGGEDRKIKLFTRHNLTCSKDLLEKYVGESIIDGETEWQFLFPYFAFRKYTMEYRNEPGALGFTYLSRIDEQYKDTHTISIDGVSADAETIADGRYPVVENIVAVTRADPSEETMRLLAWILSEEGQSLVEKSGFAPVAV